MHARILVTVNQNLDQMRSTKFLGTQENVNLIIKFPRAIYSPGSKLDKNLLAFARLVLKPEAEGGFVEAEFLDFATKALK